MFHASVSRKNMDDLGSAWNTTTSMAVGECLNDAYTKLHDGEAVQCALSSYQCFESSWES